MEKGIHDPDTVELLSVLHVFGQENAAFGSLRGRNDQRVPPGKLKPILDGPREFETIRVELESPAPEVTYVFASRFPVQSRAQLLGHGDVVFGQDLLAQAPGFGSPQMLQPLRGARLLFRLRGIAGVDEDVRVNEGENDRAAPAVKGNRQNPSTGRAF